MNALEKELHTVYKALTNNGFISSDLKIDQVKYPEIRVGRKTLVLFCSNNYLGLSNLGYLKNVAKSAVDKLGYSTSESRKLGGNLSVYDELESELAKFKHKESGVVFATGLLANLATISALGGAFSILEDVYKIQGIVDKEVLVFSDQYNHRSIQMGIKLSGAKKITYKHMDVTDLDNLMRQYSNPLKFIVTDSVFSMHGEIAPLQEIVEIAQKHSAMLMIDDAHGTGVFGKQGRGVANELGVDDQVDISMGTLSKSFGGIGGFIATKYEIANYVKNVASGYRFTSSLPPEQASVALATINVVKKSDIRRKRIWENVKRVKEILDKYGFVTNLNPIHIIPIYCESIEQAKRYESILANNNIIAPAITAPVVPVDQPLIRLVVNSTHTSKHISMLEYGLKECKESDGKHKRIKR